ncbi:MAG: hypothetical protein AB8B83_02415 [Bdellovibrionales bacterium]
MLKRVEKQSPASFRDFVESLVWSAYDQDGLAQVKFSEVNDSGDLYEIEIQMNDKGCYLPLSRLVISIEDFEGGVSVVLGHRYAMDETLAIEPFTLHHRFKDQVAKHLPDCDQWLVGTDYQVAGMTFKDFDSIDFSGFQNVVAGFAGNVLNAAQRPTSALGTMPQTPEL